MNDKLRNVVVRIKSTEYSHNKTNMDAFTFTATVASKGYHVHKTTSWINAKAGEKGTVELETTAWSLDTDPYACAIRIKNKYFSSLITVGHIPRDISRHVHFFIKTEDRKVNRHVKSLTYRPSPPSPAGFRNPTPVNIFVWAKGSLKHNEGFRKQSMTGIIQL